VTYNVVFDITSAGYRTWSFAAFGLIFVAIGAILVTLAVWRKALPFPWWSKRPTASKVFAFFFFSFAVVWTVSAFLSTYHDYSTLTTALKNGNAHVIEGLVTNFQPMPVTGHAMERFCVSVVCFEYSDYVVTSGFNNTSSHGGPIREGLPIRVTYFGNAILKLEVAK
jgi:polyferredoxin